MRANNVTDNIIKASDGTGDEYCSLDCLFCVLRVDHVRAGPGLKFSAIPPCPMGRVLQGVTPLPGDTVPEARQAPVCDPSSRGGCSLVPVAGLFGVNKNSDPKAAVRSGCLYGKNNKNHINTP